MKLTLSTILTLSVFLSTTCPSAVNNNHNNVASEETTFNDLPMELKEMIFLYAPDAYDSFFRAVPHYEGCPRIEMNRLMLSISEEEPTWRVANEAANMALRLASPVPLDPENPDIMKVSPSSILKWFRYLRARSKMARHFEFALYYFARSPDFSEWYRRWTEEEKEEFGTHMAVALILAGKIDEAFEITDRENLHYHYSYYCYVGSCPSTIHFLACLRDDPEYLKKVLTKLQKHKLNAGSFHIFSAAIRAKAKKIIDEYKYIIADASHENLWSTFQDALTTKDVEFFSKIFNLCRGSPNFNIEKIISNNDFFAGAHRLSMLSMIMDKINFDFLTDSMTCTIFWNLMTKEYVNEYKMLFDRIKMLDVEKMNRIAPELVKYALGVRNECFIEHLATEGGVPHKVIVRILENCLFKLREDIQLEYLLTTVDGKLPIAGSYDLLENRLITLLIKGRSSNGCKIAFSKNSQGERKYPFVRVTPEHVRLAMKRCRLCLLYFPANLVNAFIEENPECFTRNANVFSVLTSALDGKPRFSAMTKYWNVEYLEKIVMDEQSHEFELLVNPYFKPNILEREWEKIESMFGLLEFTPALNLALNKRLIREEHDLDGTINVLFPHFYVLHHLLSKKKDRSPDFPHFKLNKNVFFVNGIHEFLPYLLHSYEGNPLYGLSLTYEDEGGINNHLLYKLPQIKNRAIVKKYIDFLLDNDGRGNFVLNEINEDLVRKAAEFYSETEIWYSELLLRKLDTLRPPFLAKEIEDKMI